MGRRNSRAACTPAIFELVVDSLYAGITIAQLAESNIDNLSFPDVSTIRAYVSADNARKAIYARAREACADALAEQVLVEADSDADPSRSANRMKGRQWLAAKLQPKVYGDKLDLDVTNKVDIGTAILAARRRLEPLTIDNEPEPAPPTVDPFS